MPPRTLASLAHALTVANDVQAALGALGEALADIDRFAQIALVKYDHRRSMLRERLKPNDGGVDITALDTTIDHLPNRERVAVMAGGQFVEFADSVDEFARLFQLPSLGEAGWLLDASVGPATSSPVTSSTVTAADAQFRLFQSVCTWAPTAVTTHEARIPRSDPPTISSDRG